MFKIYRVTEKGKIATFTFIGEMCRRDAANLVNHAEKARKSGDAAYQDVKIMGYDICGNLAVGG